MFLIEDDMADFKGLARVLNISEKRARRLWQKVKLDADEKRSIGERFRLPCLDIGQNGDVEYNRGVKKLKAAIRTR